MPPRLAVSRIRRQTILPVGKGSERSHPSAFLAQRRIFSLRVHKTFQFRVPARELATGKSPEPADKNVRATAWRYGSQVAATKPRLPMNRVAQASRLRVRAPSRCPFPELAARRRQGQVMPITLNISLAEEQKSL